MNRMFAVMIGLALLMSLDQPTRVLACSGMLPTLEQSAEAAPLVVIGSLWQGSENVITLEVESYLKNPQPTAKLIINNHQIVGTGAGDCGVELGAGHHFQDGTRVLAFLEPDTYDVGAEWRVAGLFVPEAYPIIDDTLKVPSATGFEEITLEATLVRIVDVTGIMADPFAPALAPAPQAYPEPVQPRPTATPVPVSSGATSGSAGPVRLAGIPVVPLVLLLIAVFGFGAAAWGILRQRREAPLR